MQTSPLDPAAHRVLRAVYELAQLDVPAHAGIVGRAAGVRTSEAAQLLITLEAAGLVDATRARLTMHGLVAALAAPALALAEQPWLEALRSHAKLAVEAAQPSLHARGEER